MNKGVYILLFLLALSSCGKKPYYADTHVFNSGVWSSGEMLAFEFEISDLNGSYDLSLLFRVDSDYEYQNMWVLMHNTFPDGSIKTDTVNIPIVDARGAWLGDKKGNLFNYTVLFGRNHRFLDSGKYNIRLEHAVMNPVLNGLSDVTLMVEQK
jgi:gliding motility-associated lipoprotein GldH